MKTTISIRKYEPGDAAAVTDIFYDSIHQVAVEYYSKEQLLAWAPLPKDYTGWEKRLVAKPPYVAERNQQIVGFTTLEADGHIDWTYTHQDFQRQGIAGMLYDYLLEQARLMGIQSLYVEASYFAKPFFAKRGFEVVRENATERNGQVLINWSMQRLLSS